MRKLLLVIIFGLPSAIMGEPTYSKPHGLYAQSFALSIRGDNAGAEIRYTTDGSEPTLTSNRYTGPFIVSKTLVVRAAEFINGERLSKETTASYIFPSMLKGQTNRPEGYPMEWGKFCSIVGVAPADYEMDPELTSDGTFVQKMVEGFQDLPILSIVTNRDNLFNQTNDETTGGIYIYTGCPVGDDTGRGWERPVSVELFGGEQEYDMTVDCALKLHGGHSRLPEKNPKHSFRLTFKDDYGPSKLHYPIYGEEYIETFNSLVVRTFFGDSWLIPEYYLHQAQYIRDMWMRMMQKRMRYPHSEGVYLHTFINGLYWGIYNLSERIDDSYCKTHFGGKKEDYDIIKQEGPLIASEGNLQKWNELISLSSNASQTSVYNRIVGANGNEPLLDVDNFIDYMLLNLYAGNADWDYHNWFAVRNRKSADVGFRFVCWDSETIFLDVKQNLLDLKNAGCPTALFHNLMLNDTFKHRFIDRAWLRLSENGLLTERHVVELWDSLYQTISGALYAESARWGDYRRDVHPYLQRGDLFTVDYHYMRERKRLITSYFPQRTGIFVQQLKDKGWYAKCEPPIFMVNGHEAEEEEALQAGDVLTLQGGSKIFYTTDGSDPIIWTITSMGKEGPSAIEYTIGDNLLNDTSEQGTLTIRAICQSIQGWSPTVKRTFYIKSSTGTKLPKAGSVSSTEIYDIWGHKMMKGILPKGIYIIDGKKSVIK